MTEQNLKRLVAFVIAAYNRRRVACQNFETLEVGLLRQLQERKLRAMSYHGYRLAREKAPTVKCNGCGRELEKPAGLPEDYQSERLKVTKLKTEET